MAASESKSKSLPLPPGKLGLPLIGETLDLISDSRKFVKERRQKYGEIFKTNILGQNTIYVIGSEAISFLLKGENQYIQTSLLPGMKKLLGNFISNQTGNIHKSRRQIIAQAFKPRALVDYHQTIIEITNEYLRKWEKKESFSWYPELLDYTFDVACNFLIGLPSASETPLKDCYQTFVTGLFSLSTLPLPWTNFGKAMKSREQLLQDIEEIIVNRQEEKEKKSDALTILLSAKDEDGNNLSLAELKDQILNLLFAGHSTLASALSSFCLLMAQHPEVLAKLRQEQEQIKEPISMETRPQMPYLDQVIKEVLRLIPPVGGGFRRIIQDFELNGYYFPQGWSVIYEIAETHQDQKVWPEPEDFNPDRFAEGIKPKPFTHIPFGGGMRECLGKELAQLEMKIFTALLVRNYQWSLLPNQDLSLELVPFPRPKDNLQVKFYSRDHG